MYIHKKNNNKHKIRVTWKSHSCRRVFLLWRNTCPLRGRDSRNIVHNQRATSSPGHSGGTCRGWACHSPRTLSAYLLLARTVLEKLMKTKKWMRIIENCCGAGLSVQWQKKNKWGRELFWYGKLVVIVWRDWRHWFSFRSQKT